MRFTRNSGITEQEPRDRVLEEAASARKTGACRGLNVDIDVLEARTSSSSRSNDSPVGRSCIALRPSSSRSTSSYLSAHSREQIRDLRRTIRGAAWRGAPVRAAPRCARAPREADRRSSGRRQRMDREGDAKRPPTERQRQEVRHAVVEGDVAVALHEGGCLRARELDRVRRRSQPCTCTSGSRSTRSRSG